jgi:hypothetical protein
LKSSTFDIPFGFDMAMDCASVTNALSLNMSVSGRDLKLSFSKSAVKYDAVTCPGPSPIAGGDTAH